MTRNFYKTANSDLGIIYSDAENFRMSPLGIIADYTIVDAPKELKSEIGKYNTFPKKHMVRIKNYKGN